MAHDPSSPSKSLVPESRTRYQKLGSNSACSILSSFRYQTNLMVSEWMTDVQSYWHEISGTSDFHGVTWIVYHGLHVSKMWLRRTNSTSSQTIRRRLRRTRHILIDATYRAVKTVEINSRRQGSSIVWVCACVLQDGDRSVSVRRETPRWHDNVSVVCQSVQQRQSDAVLAHVVSGMYWTALHCHSLSHRQSKVDKIIVQRTFPIEKHTPMGILLQGTSGTPFWLRDSIPNTHHGLRMANTYQPHHFAYMS